jgi:hypothetical protein
MARKVTYEPLPMTEFKKELNQLLVQAEFLKNRAWAHFDSNCEKWQESKTGKDYEDTHDYLCDVVNELKALTKKK